MKKLIVVCALMVASVMFFSSCNSNAGIFAYHGGVKQGRYVVAVVLFSEKLCDSEDLYYYRLMTVEDNVTGEPARHITAIGPKNFANSEYVWVTMAEVYLQDDLQKCAFVTRDATPISTAAKLEK